MAADRESMMVCREGVPGGKPSHGSDMVARRRLELRIRRQYALRWIEVEAQGRSFEIAKVADPNTVFHDAIYDEQRIDGPLAWEPYWAEAWESSVVLAQLAAEWICKPPSHAARSPGVWMDLGCGVGVVGAIAAAFGAEVLLGDIAQPGLLFSQLNAWPWKQRARVRRIDWANDRLDQKFDVIACADCVYDRKHWDDLDRFWRYHLADEGCVLISEPNRISGREFRSTIVERGWWLDPSPGVRRINQREIVISRLTPKR